MKIYFLYLPKPYLVQPNQQVGMGLLLLATYAKELGAEVEVIDAQGESPEWFPVLEDGATICITACSVDVPVLNRMIKNLKQKSCVIFVGGPVSEAPKDIEGADLVVQGPGEMFIETLLGVQNYDKYPISDRTLLNHFGGNIFHNNVEAAKSETSTTLLTSRGCRFNCAFCVSGGSDEYYEYSLSRIKKEINQIKSLGIDSVRISDDNIIISPHRLAAICSYLDKAGLSWRASLRTKPNKPEMYRMMVDHGCMELSFGIESGDDNILKIMQKGNTVADNTEAVWNALRQGVPNIRALMMMGTPGETAETLELNKKWIDQFPEITVCMCMFYPFPGTQIRDNPDLFGCKIEELENPNIYMFRADDTEPEAHISILGGFSRDELTAQYKKMRKYILETGQANKG